MYVCVYECPLHITTTIQPIAYTTVVQWKLEKTTILSQFASQSLPAATLSCPLPSALSSTSTDSSGQAHGSIHTTTEGLRRSCHTMCTLDSHTQNNQL